MTPSESPDSYRDRELAVMRLCALVLVASALTEMLKTVLLKRKKKVYSFFASALYLPLKDI